MLGIGTSRNHKVCTWTGLLCVVFYSQAKVFTAWFLVERARLVTAPLVPRLKNKLYLFNVALSSLWIVILGIVLAKEHGTIRPDYECRIGMGAGPVAGIITVNAFLELWYTSLFALPLYRGEWANPLLKRLAIRSCVAALLSVSSTTINGAFLFWHNGHELSWVCTTTCSLETFWCSIVLYALTGKKDDRAPETPKTSVGGSGGAPLTSAEKDNANQSRRATATYDVGPKVVFHREFKIVVDGPDDADNNENIKEPSVGSSPSGASGSRLRDDVPVLNKDFGMGTQP